VLKKLRMFVLVFCSPEKYQDMTSLLKYLNYGEIISTFHFQLLSFDLKLDVCIDVLVYSPCTGSGTGRTSY